MAECVDAGVPCLQEREKDLPYDERRALARTLREVTARAGARLFVNGDVDLAREVGADGVHRPARVVLLPEDAGGLMLAGSTHSLVEARQAEDDGLDFIVFGPIFDTPSKRPFGPPLGLDALARVAATVRIPVLAIGGITPERVRETRLAGAAGVAVISAILGADEPGQATKRFLEALL